LTFEAGQIEKRNTNKERTQKRETDRREITEGDHRREIKGATRDTDQRKSKDQSRGTRTAPRHNVRGSEYIVKRDCNDD
jgi:hypothetical protein